MLRKLFTGIVILTATSAALAQSAPPHFNIIPVPTANPNLFLVDVEVIVDSLNGDAWAAASVGGTLFDGATFVYALDPNSGEPVPTAPEAVAGPGNREVTFVSLPREQNQNSRYRRAAGAVVVGGDDPPAVIPSLDPNFVNLAFLEIPISETQGSGFTMRVAIDMSGHALAPADVLISFADPGAAPSIASINLGTATFQHPPKHSRRFYIVPEATLCPGDLDGDRSVGLSDLALLLAAFGSINGESNYNAAGDFDNDGDNDLADLAVQLANFGTVCS